MKANRFLEVPALPKNARHLPLGFGILSFKLENERKGARALTLNASEKTNLMEKDKGWWRPKASSLVPSCPVKNSQSIFPLCF
jgi:hypothetical protein